jgi:hypothetical protein
MEMLKRSCLLLLLGISTERLPEDAKKTISGTQNAIAGALYAIKLAWLAPTDPFRTQTNLNALQSVESKSISLTLAALQKCQIEKVLLQYNRCRRPNSLF